ncbi:MAG TPA: ABC transporter permease subunit [Thermoplasmata archaeon]|nr:ABC transporter permease subunit [Thermoplasmata archaeon]
MPLFFVFVYGFAWYDDSYILHVWPFDPINYADAVSIGRGALVIPLLLRTFGMAALTTVVSLVVGYAMAYYIARLAKERWRGLLMGLVVIPFWISFIVRIYAVFPFTNTNSFIHDGLRAVYLGIVSEAILAVFELGTGQMVIFTLMYVWLPFMILPLFASLSKVDATLLEAAYDLGASRWRAFLHVTLPLTYPAIVVGSILVFITSVGAFIETEMVGGGAWLFIGNYVQTQFAVIGGLPQAAASAMFIIIVTVLLISVYRRYAELEEQGGTEVRSYVIGPIWRWLKANLKLGKPREKPTLATLPDGGVLARFGIGSRSVVGGPVRKAPWESALDWVSEKTGKLILGGVTALMLLMFFVPLIIVGIFSFNSDDNLFYFGRFSLDWWLGRPDRDGFLQDEDALRSILYSFVIAGASSVLALFVGMLAAFAMNRYRFRARNVLQTAMYLGLVIPSLILGISIAILIRFLNYYVLGPLSMGYGFGTPVQWDYGLASVIVGHTTFNIPLATLVLLISFREFDRTLEEAAMNLGADEITTFFRVTLPNIMPGIISAILLGFTFSFDELPVTLFLYGQDVITVPVFIYSLISKKILSPRVNAASVVVLLLSLVFVVLMTRLGKRGGQLFRI